MTDRAQVLLRPARLGLLDLIRLSVVGLRARPTRVLLSATGIAIGVAAMIAVIGVSASSKAEVNQRLDALGTNVLRVAPAPSLQGGSTTLPVEASPMISRIGPVEYSASIGLLDGVAIYRNDHLPAGRTNSLAVLATEPQVLKAAKVHLESGVWFNSATERYPAVILGATAANRLDVHLPGVRLWIADRWFSLIGVLRPVPLAPELDGAALVGWTAAQQILGFDGHPTTIYIRAAPSQVANVSAVLPRTADPQHPENVQVTKPTDALAAQEVADSALTALLLGLGGVALLVGAVGAGNTMIISVLERQSEIGLRRSQGATRGQIRAQFLSESLLLCALGGLAGSVLGILITASYALLQGWPTVVPVWATLTGVGVTLLAGALAGVYPAVRASRLSPSAALSAP